MRLAPENLAPPALVAPPPAPAAQWWRDAAVAGAWFIGFSPVVLWLAHGGLVLMRTPAGAALSLGRLSALLSTSLLIVLFLSLARIPFVERTWGQDDLLRLHRSLATLSLGLLLLHLVLSNLGHTLTGSLSLGGVLANFIARPSGVLAVVGTLLLVLVAATSALRDQMKYVSWYAIHLYAYAGVLLAIPHQFTSGSDFRQDPASALYWAILWGICLISVLVFRVIRPQVRSSRAGLVVSQVVSEGPGLVSIFVTGDQLSALPFQAGQYGLWRFERNGKFTPRVPLYVSAAPAGSVLRLTANVTGETSRLLAAIQPGSRARCAGPLGRHTPQSRSRSRVTFMAAGVGIAPIRALIEATPLVPGEATLIYRAHEPERFVFSQEIETLAAVRGISVFYVPGPRDSSRDTWMPESAAGWNEEEALRRLVPDIHTQDVYVSGKPGWLDKAAGALQRAGVAEDRIHRLPVEWE